MSCAKGCRCPYCAAKAKRNAVHALGGYCAQGTRLEGDPGKVLEAKDVIEPDPVHRWRWRANLCETCKLRGGVLLFNRAIHERRMFEDETEAGAIIRARAQRLAVYEENERTAAAKAEEKKRQELERLRAKEQRRLKREAKRLTALGKQQARTARRAARSVANDNTIGGAR